jgi:rhodanese-related sulfurtransferase
MHTHARHVEPVSYAGEITPPEAWERLKRENDAVLIDVRTPPEWSFSGEPDLSALGKDQLRLSWKLFPTYALNDQFISALKAAGLKQDAPLLFLCRTGGRSLDAAIAATAQGFSRCYNITDGFEGAPNAHHQRGMLTGWKASGLPWRQS